MAGGQSKLYSCSIWDEWCHMWGWRRPVSVLKWSGVVYSWQLPSSRGHRPYFIRLSLNWFGLIPSLVSLPPGPAMSCRYYLGPDNILCSDPNIPLSEKMSSGKKVGSSYPSEAFTGALSAEKQVFNPFRLFFALS